jgi:hypothetical protein
MRPFAAGAASILEDGNAAVKFLRDILLAPVRFLAKNKDLSL